MQQNIFTPKTNKHAPEILYDLYDEYLNQTGITTEHEKALTIQEYEEKLFGDELNEYMLRYNDKDQFFSDEKTTRQQYYQKIHSQLEDRNTTIIQEQKTIIQDYNDKLQEQEKRWNKMELYTLGKTTWNKIKIGEVFAIKGCWFTAIKISKYKLMFLANDQGETNYSTVGKVMYGMFVSITGKKLDIFTYYKLPKHLQQLWYQK